MNLSSESPDSPEPSELPDPSVAEEGFKVPSAELRDAPVQSQDSPGACLRAARVARGLTIADVANSIKFSPRQIETIERDDFDRLPGTTFVRGFIRSYAKLLQLDDHALLAMLDRQKPQADVQIYLPQDTGAALPQPGEQRTYLPYLILLAVLVLIGIVLAVFLDWPRKADTSPLAGSNVAPILQPPLAYIEQPPATPIVPAQPAVPPAGPGSRQLIFVFEDKSWVEVTDATQQVIFAQLNEPDTRQIVNGTPPFTLVIGNASRVQLQFEDQQVDLRPYTKVDVARLTLE